MNSHTSDDAPCPVDLRYARHASLAPIGHEGQASLAASSALVIGLGGLGAPAALYLASSGVGTLWLNDFDRVDITNLQRQILYREADVGARKCAAARRALEAINSTLRYEEIDQRLAGPALVEAVARADVVLDGSDNFATRFAVNEACAAAGTPLVSGAAIRFDGQLAVFRHDHRRAGADTPCYRCLFAESDEAAEDCQGNGVFAPLVGTIGTMMAAEALKVLLKHGEDSEGRLLTYDALTLNWRSLRLRRDPACPVCASPGAVGSDGSRDG